MNDHLPSGGEGVSGHENHTTFGRQVAVWTARRGKDRDAAVTALVGLSRSGPMTTGHVDTPWSPSSRRVAECCGGG